MNISVTGDVDGCPYDKNKMLGFIDAFSNVPNVNFSYIKPHLSHNIPKNKQIDILFGESGDFDKISYDGIKNAFIWGLIDVESLAKNNPNTNFYMCSKSILHDSDVIDEYLRLGFSPNYLQYGSENVNVVDFKKKIQDSRKISKDTYQLSDNFYYMYLPCCLAQSTIRKSSPKDIDVTYFGTLHNRPNVVHMLKVLESSGLNVSYNKNGYISPEECISLYNRSIVTLHENVGPVYLDFTVRCGEAPMCNSKIFMLNRISGMKDFAKKHETVPECESFDNVDHMIFSIKSYIHDYKNGINQYVNEKPNTYRHYANMVVDLCKQKQ